jgi:hypothetical protein
MGKASHIPCYGWSKRIAMDAATSIEGGARPKRAKFRDLAEKRTNRALEAIHRIGNLSNRQLYEWEEGELRKILKALRDAIAEVEGKFASPKAVRDGRFKL